MLWSRWRWVTNPAQMEMSEECVELLESSSALLEKDLLRLRGYHTWPC